MKKNKHMIPLLIVAVLIFAIVFYFVGIKKVLPNIKDENFDKFVITSTSYAPYGITPDSKFSIITPFDYSKKDMTKMLSVSPKFDFNIEKTGKSTYLLTPKTTLDIGKKYVFTFNGENREIAPKNVEFIVLGTDITVKSSFPIDKSVNVPTRTAVDFNFSVPVKDVEKFIEITPKIKGDFKYNQEVITFIVKDDSTDNQFLTNTKYTFKIKKGVEGIYGGKLLEDYEFSFSTGTAERRPKEIELTSGYYYNENAAFSTFLPDEKPIIDIRNNVYANGKGYYDYPEEMASKYKELDFSVEVFKFNDYSDYLYYLYAKNSSRYDYGGYSNEMHVDTTKLSSITKYNTKIDFSNQIISEQRFASIILPETLSTGWYVANCTVKRHDGGDDILLQKFLQISPITYYQQTSNNQSLIWLNDGMNGKSLSECAVNFYNNPSIGGKNITLSTDKEGVVVFEEPVTPEMKDEVSIESKNFYYVVSNENGTLCGEIKSITPNAIKVFDEDYYNYLYTDRNLYNPTDKIDIWGTICPITAEIKPVTKVKAVLCWDWNIENVIKEIPLTITEDGVFSGIIEYENLASGFYCIYIVPEGIEQSNLYFNKAIEILQYKLPDYTYTVSADKPFYTSSDTINANFEMNFFDGTPMAETKLKFKIGEVYGKGVINDGTEYTTDKNGKISASVKVSDYLKNKDLFAEDTWHPITLNLNFFNEKVEDVEFKAEAPVHIFPHSTMITATSTGKDGKVALTINTNNIDISKLKNFEDCYKSNYEIIKGSPVSKDLKITIMHSYNKATDNGTSIDPYTNEVVHKYNYEYMEEEINQLTEKTNENGTVTINDLPACDSDNGYSAIITIMGDNGREIKETINLGERVYPNYGKGYSAGSQIGKEYSYDVTTNAPKNLNFGYQYGCKFNADDTVKVSVLENQKNFEIPTNARFMISTLQKEIMSNEVKTKNSAEIKINETHIPNFSIRGAYFDGKHIYAINRFNMEFNNKDRELDIDVQSDKQSYLPGEEMNVTLNVKGKDGKAKADTNVCICVVNEAVYKIRPQDANLLNEFYEMKFDEYSQINTSYIQRFKRPDYGDEGGKGGGGGGSMAQSVRRNFSDNAGMIQAITNKDGIATAKIKLPDGLTSWRITVLGISKDLYVGDNKDNVVTTLPFFVKPILNKVYLNEDDVAILLRSFGNKVENGTKVEYTVDVDGKVTTVNGVTGDYKSLNLGKQKEGTHTVKIIGKCGQFSDGIELKFDVINTVLETQITEHFDLSQPIELKTNKSPLKITLYNSDYDEYVKAMSIITSGYSNRNDEKVAKKLIYPAMKDFYGENRWLDNEYTDILDISNYVGDCWNDENGFKLFPYSEPSIIALSRAIVSSPKDFVKNDIYAHFSNILDTQIIKVDGKIKFADALQHSQEEFAASVLGLSVAKKDDKIEITMDGIPLKDIIIMLMDSPEMTLRGKFYLVAAQSNIDKVQANKMYDEIIKPLIKANGKELFIEKENVNNEISLTSAALINAILLDRTMDSDGFIRYIYENQGFLEKRGECAFEVAMYINTFVPRRTSQPVVSYVIDGKTVEQTLDKANKVRLTLSKDEFLQADFKVKSGTAMAQVDYKGSPEENKLKISDDIKIKRTIQPINKKFGGTTNFKYEIEFSSNAKEGSYKLVTWIPTNVRLKKQSLPTEPTPIYYNLDMNEQLLTAYFDYSKQAIGNKLTISFDAQNVFDCKAKCDNVYLFNTYTMECYALDDSKNFSW